MAGSLGLRAHDPPSDFRAGTDVNFTTYSHIPKRLLQKAAWHHVSGDTERGWLVKDESARRGRPKAMPYRPPIQESDRLLEFIGSLCLAIYHWASQRVHKSQGLPGMFLSMIAHFVISIPFVSGYSPHLRFYPEPLLDEFIVLTTFSSPGSKRPK